MSNITSRTVKLLLALVLGLVGAAGAATPALATEVPTGSVVAQAACGDVSDFDVVALSDLPSQATDTVILILDGGPYPFPQDDGVFQNREGLLPACSLGYYHEYTVITPGSDDRGARRIVTGSRGEFFYTSDHYASFDLVDIDS